MEQWHDLQVWPYAVGTFGHIRRRRGKRPVEQQLDNDGYTKVTLHRGKKRHATLYLDSLICAAFHGGYNLDTEQRPIHLDGVPWNCWPINLDWGLRMSLNNNDNLVANWSVRHDGRLQHGPFTDFNAAVAAAQWFGDVLIGRNSKHKIIAYLVNFSRNRSMSPRNPYDKAREYRALGEMHTNTAWGLMLLEAAEIVEAMAGKQLEQLHVYKLDSDAAVAQVRGEAAASPRRRKLAEPQETTPWRRRMA